MSDRIYRTTEKQRASSRAYYYRQTPEERRAARRRVREALGPEGRAAARKREHDRLRRQVIAGYGGRCACCGNDYLPHLTLDHLNGGGAEERRALTGRGIYRRLRREGFPPGYQVLCWNCNAAKHHLGECGCKVSELRHQPSRAAVSAQA